MNKKTDRAIPQILTLVLIVAIILFTISFSIGLPIYGREFYYMQIGPLEIEKATGRDRDTIIRGYDEVLDFLTRPGGEFSAGDFAFSESGADHFKDCKFLFTLNASVYVISALVIAAVLLLLRFGKIKLCRPFGLAPVFWSGSITLGLFAVLGVLISMDFDTAFVIFHSVFFPGKSNWIFNPRNDEIILAMPESFFMNCAILIGSSVILMSLAFVAVGLYIKIRARKCSLK